MLIIDRTQRAWATLSAVVCFVAGMVYIWYANWSPNGPSGGSVPGLIFGLIAAAMMIFAGLLAARRRFPTARVGSAQFWMKGHLWIGTLTIPFALFHAGFGLGGPVEILLWILFFAVILSGFWGLFLQQVLPRMMLENLPRETFIEQIPHLCQRFTADSDHMLSELCGPLDLALTAIELKQFEPHLRPHFEEHRKKNRNDYPKTESDAVHFQRFLSRVYASVPAPQVTAAPSVARATAVSAAAPVMKSVAQIKSPAGLYTVPPADSAIRAEPVEAPAAAAKPDPKALLAAAKAKKALESPVADLAAPTSLPPSELPPDLATTSLSAKPDPKAILAAARAKKAAAATAASPLVPTLPSDGDPAEPEAVPPSPPPVAPSSKPDPKAMMAAMKAKRDAAAHAATVPVAGSVPETKSNPLAQLKAVKDLPAVSEQALVAAARVAPPTSQQTTELKLFYQELIRPQLPMQPVTRGWTEAMRRSVMACNIRSDNQHPEFIRIFEHLLDLCEQRRQFALTQRYHAWLHDWLLVHIPCTVALYLILAVHAVVALRVVPFGN